ncbi:MAG: DUF4476 domain-containing protein [Flavobacteriales bacterium]|nr:DUF4476 domain-containing protein [Flavobacteriales bacterium]
MRRILTLALAGSLSFSGLLAQTCDLVVFSDMGEKFTLMVDGAEINATPASRVVATGIRIETPSLLVRFADTSVPPIKQNGWFPLGKEYTMSITMNKKGVRVIRPSGEAELGTAAKAEPVKPKPTTFTEDAPVAAPAATQESTESVEMNVGGETITTTVVEESSTDGDVEGENVNMSFGVNGMGVNMNVNVSGTGTGTGVTTTSSGTRTTTTTTTTTVSRSGGTTAPAPSKPATTAVLEPVYKMPGYNGPIGCGDPMAPAAFEEAKSSIAAKSFEDTKMTLVKQIGGSNCFTVDQVKQLMGLFSFEDNKLDLAKFAYDHTYDIGNYYKVNDAFSFESSVDELNEYIKSR